MPCSSYMCALYWLLTTNNLCQRLQTHHNVSHQDYMSSLTEEQRAQLAALLPKAPEFPWKQTPDTTAIDTTSDTCTDGTSTATATAGTATGSTTIEAVVEAPDPMVVRAIERGSLSVHDREEHATNSFMRFFV
jgi:hypothetical protein